VFHSRWRCLHLGLCLQACQRHWTAGGSLRKVQLGAGKRITRRNRRVKAKALSASGLAPAVASAGAESMTAVAAASKIAMPLTDRSTTIVSGAAHPSSSDAMACMHAQATMAARATSADVEQQHDMQKPCRETSNHLWHAGAQSRGSVDSDDEPDVRWLGQWPSFSSVPDLPDDVMLTSNISNGLQGVR
jgi:hypothetical protein